MPYSCAECNKYYNLTTRKPIELNCQCTICSNCYQNLSIKRHQKEITCPQCSATSIKSVKPAVNEIIMKKIEAQNSLIVTCEIHQTEMASHYCIECETPVCTYCQYDDTHNLHEIVMISKSQFTNYTTNVLRILNEYQKENMKALMGQQSNNEISLDSKQLKHAISKVTRMLGPHIDEEETIKIDFKSYLLDPSNFQPNFKRTNNKLANEDFNEFKKMIQDQIHQQLQESQTLFREELQQTIENNKNQITDSLQQQIQNKIKESIDDQQRVMHEFKREVHYSINYNNFDLSNKIQAIDETNKKVNQLESLINQSDQQIQTLIQSIENLKTDQGLFAQNLKESQQQLKQEIKLDFDNQLQNQEAIIQTLKKDIEQLIEKVSFSNSNYNSLIKEVQESKLDCQNKLKILDDKFAEYNDKVDQLKQSISNEMTVQSNMLLEFQQSSKSYASKSDIDIIEQKLNQQEIYNQKSDQEYKSLLQNIQQNQDQQALNFQSNQEKIEQNCNQTKELTIRFEAINLRHEQELKDSKLVQDNMNSRLTSLDKEVKSAQISIQNINDRQKSAFEKQSKQVQKDMNNILKDQQSIKSQYDQQVQALKEAVENLKKKQVLNAQNSIESQTSFKQQIQSDVDHKLKEFETIVQTLNKDNEQLNMKLSNADSNQDQLMQQLQQSKCNCENEIKLLENIYADQKDQIDSLKLSTEQEINHQAKRLQEFQQTVKSNATKADIDEINQKMNSQDKYRQKFDSEYQNLKKSVQTIQECQEQQTKDFKQIQSKSKQDIDALTEKLHTISIKHEQQLLDSKHVQNAFDLRLTNLEQELKSAFEEQSQQLKEEMKNLVEDQESLKLQFDTFSNELLRNIYQLQKECDQNHQINVQNNSQIKEEVKSSDIIQNNILDSIRSSIATIVNRQIQQEEQKVQANGIIKSLVQVPSVEECLKLSDQLKIKLFRDLVDQEINKTQHSLLQEHISEYSTKQFNLLFCGSHDGFTASKFHELCDEKGPTVCFILSEYGLVFGGYTSLPWTSPPQYAGQFYSDPSAFVFSLSKRSIHKQYRNQDRAVWHYKDWMCVFGGYPCDIVISNNCDQNSDSYCNLGSTFDLPNGYKYESNEATSYLAGQYKFKVLEIQVYSLK